MPLKPVMRLLSGKPINRFLNHEAVVAKQERRRLERHWKKTGNLCDRLAYRQSCRSANELINKARQAYFSDRIANLSVDPRKRWAAVKELLHMSDKDKTRTDAENRATCDLITAFFTDKLGRITESLRSKLVGVAIDPFVTKVRCGRHCRM